jgi:hypothetical protein
VGGSLSVLLKTSKVRFLSLATFFFVATITDGDGRTREGQNGVAAYPLTFFIVVEIVHLLNIINFKIIFIILIKFDNL